METPCSWQQWLSGLVVSLEKVQAGRQSQGSTPAANWVWDEGDHSVKKIVILFPSEGLRGLTKSRFCQYRSRTSKLQPKNEEESYSSSQYWRKGIIFSGQHMGCLPDVGTKCLSSPSLSGLLRDGWGFLLGNVLQIVLLLHPSHRGKSLREL